jgi:hypothetical protein
MLEGPIGFQTKLHTLITIHVKKSVHWSLRILMGSPRKRNQAASALRPALPASDLAIR